MQQLRHHLLDVRARVPALRVLVAEAEVRVLSDGRLGDLTVMLLCLPAVSPEVVEHPLLLLLEVHGHVRVQGERVRAVGGPVRAAVLARLRLDPPGLQVANRRSYDPQLR